MSLGQGFSKSIWLVYRLKEVWFGYKMVIYKMSNFELLGEVQSKLEHYENKFTKLVGFGFN